MTLLQQFGPYMVAMLVLAASSAFFSCSEAALFSLSTSKRRALTQGGTTQQITADLMARPNRLLTAILFWNLMINIVYFALASLISIQLESQSRHAEAGLMTVGSLLTIIIFSEMLPKTIGVLAPRLTTSFVVLPLAIAVRVIDPIAPLFTGLILALRRLMLPNFRVEPYLQLTDLEQAISVSTADEELAAQERSVLQNIVSLSDLRAEELMRPRTQYQSFRPPVELADLGGQITRSGYLLVADYDTEEIVGAIALKNLPSVPRHHLEHFAQPVVYIPWCATVAAIFEELQSQDREVAAIVNEHGETIGIVTLEDLLQTVFEDQASRSSRLLETTPIHALGENLWRVTGITSLRRLGRAFNVSLPPSKSSTVAGIVQELLQRIPVAGDTVRWEPFEFKVVEADQPKKIMVELRLVDDKGAVR